MESGGALTVTAVETAPELVERFNVTTVPYFVLDGRHGFAGPLPELMLLQRLADLKENRT